VGSEQLTKEQKLVERLEYFAEDGVESLKDLACQLRKGLPEPEYWHAASAADEAANQLEKAAAACGALFNVLSQIERNKISRRR
jgi:hypothetical protein